MIKKKSKETLADKISGILSTTPASFDPEDDVDNQTSAKLLEDDFQGEEDNDEELLSQFRKQNVDLLADVDERYAGTRGSRKSLKDESDEDEEGLENSDVEDVENEQTDSEAEGNIDEGDDDSNEVDDNSEEQDSNASDVEDADSDEEYANSNASDVDTNFSHFKETDASQQIKKGQCVRNQLSLWESLLEMRIQLQKCLLASNKMPQTDVYKKIKNESGIAFTDKVAETKTNLSGVLEKLLQLQKLVLKKYPETKNLDKKQADNKTVEDPDDEEIPSDTEDELEAGDSEEEDDEKATPQKRRKLNDYENVLNEMHQKYQNYRNSVIQKWNDKTRIAVAKNNSQSHSVLNQIEHNLGDKIRLRKRTQLKRSDYKIIGEQEQINNIVVNEDNVESKPMEEYNTNIYDDDDFYHQLLRELIEVKSADITDPVQLGRQWIQLQNLRSKMKRKIDTKATKGRKIRYAVHTKLVNFMAPIDENLMTEEAKNELYSSLFGKKM